MRLSKLVSIALFGASLVYADISGIVFKDYDFNGVKNGGDAPVIGASIKATCDDGNIYTATADTNGSYILSGITEGAKCRVEADVSSAGVGSGPNANGSAPLVDIVADGAEHNISTGSPATYCQANPDVIMAALPGYYTSKENEAGGGSKSPLGFGTVFKIPNPVKGTFNKQNTIDDNRKTLVTIDDTGAIWGAAYKRSTKELFAAAVIKRYVPLKDERTKDKVAESAGTIYKISDLDNDSPSFSSFVVIPDVLSDQAKSDLTHRDYGKNKDGNVRAKYAGRQGLGDIDISEDDRWLYAVNLYKKQLVKIDTQSAEINDKIDIPNLYGDDCNDSKFRPWGLKVRGDSVYVGAVCEDRIEGGIGAIVEKYDGHQWSVLARTNSLLYLRPRGYSPDESKTSDWFQNGNWDNANRESPMLTDIEFSNNGDLILGYTSHRAYSHYGGELGGDIRKMCLESNGTYTDESTAIAPTSCKSHKVKYDDKGKNDETYYEFYIGDYVNGDDGKYGASGHPETASGALAQAPGAPGIIVGMEDGTDFYEPGSIGLYSHKTGDKIGVQAVIKNNYVENSGEREPYGAKAGGMGDVELLCDPAPIEIGDYVWMDINEDGIQDPNEPPMKDVNVTLSCGGTEIGSVKTDAHGHYYFGGIDNANLYNGNKIEAEKSCTLSIKQAEVNGKASTTKNPNGDQNDTIDNDAESDNANGTNVIHFKTTVFNDHSLDFGITPAFASIGDRVWYDTNKDGKQDADEKGVSGVKVELYDSNDKRVKTTETNATGYYSFDKVIIGDYYIRFDLGSLPNGYEVSPQDQGNDAKDSDANTTTGKTALTTLTTDENDTSWDMGIVAKPGSWNGNVSEDTNNDNAGDKPISNVKIELFSDPNCDGNQSDGSSQDTAKTDGDGNYRFNNLSAGCYVAVETQPSDYLNVTEKDGGDDGDAQGNTPINVISGKVDAGENDKGNDFVEKKAASLGDRVWYDDNANGIQDAGENGVADVKVTLYNANNNAISTITTDSNGHYSFGNLEPGDYYVMFDLDTLPAGGYVVSSKNQGSDKTKDSDADITTGKTAVTTLDAGENDTSWDMGINRPVASLGDRVWYDNNANGIQDDNEKGVQGVRVYLLDKDKNILKKTNTDADGKYVFDNLIPGKKYIVKFDKSTIDSHYTITYKTKGTDKSIDSDADLITGESDVVILSSGEYNPNIDMGMHWNSPGAKPETPYHIGTHFWVDKDNDGIMDTSKGDIPIVGAKVQLLDKDGNALYWTDSSKTALRAEISGKSVKKYKSNKEVGSELLAITYTDKNGSYGFDVPAGKYKVKFYIPKEYLDKGYVFDKSNYNNYNEDGTYKDYNDTDQHSNVGNSGVIIKSAIVGPNSKVADLTLDAGINCGCVNIKSDSSDALSSIGFVAMIMMLIGMMGLFNKREGEI